MSDQFPMFGQMISEDTDSAISSPESESGATRSGSPDGKTSAKYGRDRAPVSPSARPAKEKRSTTRGIFGQSSFGSSKHDDLSQSLASRYRALTDSLGSTLFELTWIARITPAGFSIPALRASEPRTEDSVCIGWPTPNTPSGVPTSKSTETHTGGMDLDGAATLAGWPTPVANDDNKTPEAHLAMKQRIGKRDGTGADRGTITSLQVMAQMSAWGTPAARDWKSGAASQETLDKNARPLSEQAILAGWKTPTACTENSLRGNGQEPADREAGGHAINIQDKVRLAAWKTPCVPNGGRISGNHQDLGKHRDGTKAQIGLENEARLTAFGETPIGFLLGPNGWEIVPASGQLNAAHSRWLMGLPRVWDDCGVMAMESLRKSRRRS